MDGMEWMGRGVEFLYVCVCTAYSMYGLWVCVYGSGLGLGLGRYSRVKTRYVTIPYVKQNKTKQNKITIGIDRIRWGDEESNR